MFKEYKKDNFEKYTTVLFYLQGKGYEIDPQVHRIIRATIREDEEITVEEALHCVEDIIRMKNTDYISADIISELFSSLFEDVDIDGDMDDEEYEKEYQKYKEKEDKKKEEEKDKKDK